MMPKAAFTFGLFLALVVSGCASVDVDLKAAQAVSQIDIFILATDRATAVEVLGRLHGIEDLPPLQTGQEKWSRGHLIGNLDGSVYSIVVGQVGGQDDSSMRTLMRKARNIWRPRYILVLGTASAVAYDEPLGAVGVVNLVCDFDLDRYQESQDQGKCHRADSGLFAAALSIANEWETTAKADTSRSGCSPARVLKLATLSGTRNPRPGFVDVATALSEDYHRGFLIEREGIFVAKAVQRLRHEMREPIGFLMIRGVSEVRVPGIWREVGLDAGEQEQRLLQETCAARDTADFAVDLIRKRWPVSSGSYDPSHPGLKESVR